MTLRRSRAPGPSGVGSELRKFFVYCLLGWGLPLTLTIALITAQLTLPSQSDFQPSIGVQACWLKQSANTDLYLLIIPMTAILVLNTIIFFLIVVKLILAKFETRNVRLSTRQNQSNTRTSAISVRDLAEQMVFNKDVNGQTLSFTVLLYRLFM